MILLLLMDHHHRMLLTVKQIRLCLVWLRTVVSCELRCCYLLVVGLNSKLKVIIKLSVRSPSDHNENR